jgi:hypothetical protein
MTLTEITVRETLEVSVTNIAPGSYDTQKIIKDLRSAMEFVQERVINRKEVVEQIFLAMLLGEHILIESRTGVGKTLLAEQVFAMFEGAKIFKVQASKEQQPDTYFGGLDLEELKKGRIIHNTEGSLVESEFGFIDEIFDANDYTLRALLSLLNERELVRGVQRMPSPIHTVVAATNYLRISEITEALLDRFLFKALIIPDKDPVAQYKIGQQYLMHSGGVAKPAKKISYEELNYATSVIKGLVPEQMIQFPPDMLYFMNLVIRHYEVQRNRLMKERPDAEMRGVDFGRAKDYYISPRTQAKAIDLVRSIAFLHGRDHVVRADIDRLHFLLCTAGIAEQKALFKKSFETLNQLYAASSGFEQLASLLQLEELLTKYKKDPSLMDKPLVEFTGVKAKRGFFDWAKETIGVTDKSMAHKRRLAEGFLESIHPATDDLKQLKATLEKEVKLVFAAAPEHFQ